MRRVAFLIVLLLCIAGPASADSLRLTNADLDAVLMQQDTADTPTLPDSGDAEMAPRRWWPLLASAAVPGLGELTTGYLRGIPMIAVDAGIWVGVYSKNKEGNDKEEEFEAFMLEHWSEAEWTNALAAGTLDPFPLIGLEVVPEQLVHAADHEHRHVVGLHRRQRRSLGLQILPDRDLTDVLATAADDEMRIAGQRIPDAAERDPARDARQLQPLGEHQTVAGVAVDVHLPLVQVDQVQSRHTGDTSVIEARMRRISNMAV